MLSQPLYRPIPGQTISRDARRAESAAAGAAIRNGILSAVLVAGLLALTTWGLYSLLVITEARPYSIFYLIPVAIASMLLGVRGGYVTAVASVLLTICFLIGHDPRALSLTELRDGIEIGALVVATFAVATVVGRLRGAMVDLRRLNSDLVESEERRLAFNREVLLAVTGGRLILCDQDVICGMMARPADFSVALSVPSDASALRHHLMTISERRDRSAIRWLDLMTSVTEAATNAIKHGNGGTADVWAGETEVAVLISDKGKGISPSQLARATLERGFSTRYSLGMGFTIMLDSADTLALSTSAGGTMILIRVGTGERPSAEANLLARYDVEVDAVTP